MKKLFSLLTAILFVGSMWGATIVTWSDASRTASSAVAPSSSAAGNSSARLTSECTLSTAGTGGAKGSHYGTWTCGNSIYITGLNLSGYSAITLTISNLRKASSTANFYASTDGTNYSSTAFSTKSLSNSNAACEVSDISSSVQAIKIEITCESDGNLWLGSVTISGTASAACDKKVTISAGTPETGGSFELDKTGQRDCCDNLTVTVSNITAPAGKQFSAITQSGIDAEKVTINQAAKTVTYLANTTGESTINVTFEDLPKYTVTLKDDDSQLTQSAYQASVVLPSRTGCDAYTFVGWTKSWTSAQSSWTTIVPTIIPAGSYTPNADENLYPVYRSVVSFVNYTLVEDDLTDWSGRYLISDGTNTATGVGTTNLATTEFTPGATEAANYEFELIKNGDEDNYFLIKPDGVTYVGYAASSSSKTNLTTTTSTPESDKFLWTCSASDPMLLNVNTITRYMGVGTSSDKTIFAGYSTAGTNEKCHLYKRNGAPTSYISIPNCVPSDIEDVVDPSVKAVKVLRNGVLYIEKAGKTYNAQGQLVK